MGQPLRGSGFVRLSVGLLAKARGTHGYSWVTLAGREHGKKWNKFYDETVKEMVRFW